MIDGNPIQPHAVSQLSLQSSQSSSQSVVYVSIKVGNSKKTKSIANVIIATILKNVDFEEISTIKCLTSGI